MTVIEKENKRGRNETHEGHVMPSTMAYHLQAKAQPSPQQWVASHIQLPQFVHCPWCSETWNTPWTTPGHLSWTCPCRLLVHLLTDRVWETENSFRVRTFQQQPKHHCTFSIVLILNPNHSTIPATQKKMDSVPAKTRTTSCMSHWTPKWEKKLARYMAGYCKTCFPFLAF